jgi:metallo-beta-lactamase class B
MNGVFLGLNLFVFLLAITLGQAEDLELAEDLQVRRLTDSVWLHTSWVELEDYGRVPGNGLIVMGRGEAALLDTPWTDEQVRILFAWAERDLGLKITTVVPTHSHADCMGGLAAAHETGAKSVALERTRIIAEQQGLPVPKVGFKGETMLEIGGRKIWVCYLGPGHTIDNVVVWIPNEKVLFGGCLVKSAQSRGMGYLGEANLAEWPNTIRALESKYPEAKIIVPGHGQPGGGELLQHTIDLINNQTGSDASLGTASP